MIRLILLALFFFLGYTLFTAVVRTLKGKGDGIPPEKTTRGEEMVRDPSCGTYLPKGEALRKSVGGKTYYFCSERCRKAFDGAESTDGD